MDNCMDIFFFIQCTNNNTIIIIWWFTTNTQQSSYELQNVFYMIHCAPKNDAIYFRNTYTPRCVCTHKYTLAIYPTTFLSNYLPTGGRHETLFIPFLKLNNITTTVTVAEATEIQNKRKKSERKWKKETTGRLYFLYRHNERIYEWKISGVRIGVAPLWLIPIDTNVYDFVHTHQEKKFKENLKISAFIWIWPKTIWWIFNNKKIVRICRE